MFIDLLKKRRSIRVYTDEPLSEDQVRILVSAALLSPSSRGKNPWEFILVTDRAALQRLAEAKEHGAGFLAGAALGIVVLADTSKTDAWVEDCSIAASNILLAAADLGLGACWAQIRNRAHNKDVSAEEAVRDALGIPSHMAVEAIIGVGHPAEKRPPLSEDDMQMEKVYRERYTG